MQTQQVETRSLWYKDAVIYELHVRAFCDSNGDGVGDFKGLTTKLDHLKQLGVTAIWLLPFYKSPLKDDGYDVSDHLCIHPDLGDLKDFQKFVREAHKKGLRIITELILNHTSVDHHWFQRARSSPPGSPMRQYYVWSDTNDKYKEARVIFGDYESSNWTWDPVAKAFYWHRFYSHQPDLNYDNPAVREEALRIAEFWLKMGVDGLRLDGIPYLFEREGTTCENLSETHQFLKELRKFIDSKFNDRMLLAEANQWPSDAAAYFGKDDECQMAFHFPLMPRMFMAIQLEDQTPIVEIMQTTPKIPDTCQWALFLRNHDELTLEMVTDEERDYLFKAYARDASARINLGIRRRLAPLLSNDRRKIEIMELLLLTLPGTPVIYYGDEILMGDNYHLGDRNSVRTPMQWSPARNAGFSTGNPQRLYLPLITDSEFNYETINVENQENNPTSHLWWLRKLIALRRSIGSFARGHLKFVSSGNPRVLAFIRTLGESAFLVAINLSRYTQMGELDLTSFETRTPVDIFGATRLPAIGMSRYSITFGPYGYYVFDISSPESGKTRMEAMLPEIALRNGLEDIVKGESKQTMESKVIPLYIVSQPWFKGKNRNIEVVKIRDCISFDKEALSNYRILIVDVYYREGMADTYVIPLAFAVEDYAKKILTNLPHYHIANAKVKEEKGILFDAIADENFRLNLLQLFGKSCKGQLGDLHFKLKKRDLAATLTQAKGSKLESETGCLQIMFDNFMMKLIRNPEEGINPELEIGENLTSVSYQNVRRTLGDISYLERGGGPLVVAILVDFSAEEFNLWDLSVDEANRFLERSSKDANEPPTSLLDPKISQIAETVLPPWVEDLIGTTCLDRMRNLGKVMADFHVALQTLPGKEFSPQAFGYLYQVSLAYAMSNKARKSLRRFQHLKDVPEPIAYLLNDIAGSEQRIVEIFNWLRLAKIESQRIRVHGSFELRNVLQKGGVLTIINYEAEGDEPMDTRRIMRSPLRDVAKLIRSLNRAAYTAFLRHSKTSTIDKSLLENWTFLWYKVCSGTLLQSYFKELATSNLIPHDAEVRNQLLDTFLLDACIYEMDRDLDAGSDLVMAPIRAVTEILSNSLVSS